MSSPAPANHGFDHLAGPQRPLACGRSALAEDARTFFMLTAVLGLSHAEECALLDVGRADLVLLRAEPRKALERGGAKLQRRLDYAVPLLRRMKTALEC